jgi:hypothetical protein
MGREEEGTSSRRVEMGTYTTILRRTPDHEDLVTQQTTKFSDVWWADGWDMEGRKVLLSSPSTMGVSVYLESWCQTEGLVHL